MSTERLLRLRAVIAGLTMGMAAVTLSGAFAVTASAKVVHPPLGVFGSAAQQTFATAGPLAIDQSTGDLLVIDAGAGTLSRFKPDGTPDNFSALGTNVIDGLGVSEVSA